MALRIQRRGFGATDDVVLKYPAVCGTWSVFKPQCWCLQYPNLCSSADYQAAYALANPGVYAPVQAPPVVGAPVGSTPPASGTDAQATVDALIAQQKAALDAQSMATMQQTAANLRAAAQTQCPGSDLIDNGDGSYSCPPGTPGGIPWGWIAAGVGLLAFGMVAMGGGSPRRYGR